MQMKATTLYPVLSSHNHHPRDDFIQFFEEDHKYIITCDKESTYTSVTTWNHSHFPHFDADKVIQNMKRGKGWKEGHKYWGLTDEEIKAQWDENKNAVSGAGTEMHYQIECFMNNPHLAQGYTHQDLINGEMESLKVGEKESVEWTYFLQFAKDYPTMKPYRTEWTIFDEDLKLAGSIDMVYENEDGTLSIYDWKRAKNITAVNTFNKYALTPAICHMPDSNFWHYALQLNTYKAILTRKYNKVVTDLYLVRLHPDAEEKSYELIKLPDLSKDIQILFEERLKEITKI